MAEARVNGVRLHYESRGEGEPVLFIHGLGSSLHDWDNQVRALSGGYRTIAYDIRGFGRSEKPAGPYGIPLFAEDAVGLLEDLRIQAAHVVGISMGGMIALQLAVSLPTRVKSLTVVNSLAHCIPRTLRERMQFFQRFLIVRLLGMRTMGRVLAGRLFPDVKQEEIRRNFTESWAKNDKRAYREALSAISRWSVADRLGLIRCPTLVLASDLDYWSIADKQAYAGKIRGAELKVIRNSRHAMPLDQPDAMNAALLEFIQKR